MINTVKKLWEFSKHQHKTFIITLIMSLIHAFIGVTQLIAIMIAMDVLINKAPVEPAIRNIVILTVICALVSFATSFFEHSGSVAVGFYMTADKRIGLGNFLKMLPLGFFSDNAAGKIVAALTTTLGGIETGAAMAMITTVSGIFSAISMFTAVCFYEWRIGVITGIGMVIYLFVVDLQMKVSEKNAPLLQRAQNVLAEAALTFLQGIKVTKAFSVKEGNKELNEAVSGSRDANIRLTSKAMPTQFLGRFVIAVFEILIITCTLWMRQEGSISLVKTIMLLVFSFMAYVSLNQAGSVLSMIGLLDSGLKVIGEVEEAKQMSWSDEPKTMSGNDIELKNVNFSYGDNEVLHDVSVTIKENSLTAIIGPSCSGKTTLCELIPRFRDINSGSITIGGVDIRDADYEELMKRISMVFQRVYLFEDSIYNNIAFGRPGAGLEEARRAARAAKIDEFIEALPDGYNTVLDEGGSSLSGGEKQRISIARAILKDSPIIIMDEATAALDAENEHEILAAIEALTKNKTVIMIAHRINSIKNADHIIAIKDGRVVQDGSPKELVEKEGLYRDFLRSREEISGWTINN